MKKYRHQTVRKPLYVYSMVALYFVAVLLPLRYLHSQGSHLEIPSAVLPASLGGISGLIGMLLGLQIYGGTRIWMDNDAIFHTRWGREKRILFSEIIEIKAPSIGYLSGHLIVRGTGGKKITIRATMENIVKLVTELKEGVDAAGKSDVYDRKKLFSYLKTSAHNDHGFDFMPRLANRLLKFGTISWVVGIIAFFIAGLPMKALFFMSVALIPSVWVALVGLVWFLFSAQTHIDANAIKSDFVPPTADIKKEGKIIQKTTYLLVAVHLLVGVFIASI